MSNQSTEGKAPRRFTMDPMGNRIIAENQDSDSVVVLGLYTEGGKLRSTGEKIELGKPVCVVFTGK